MLASYQPPVFSDEEVKVFDNLVPFDHWLRRAEQQIDFLALRCVVEPFYCVDNGAPGVEPVLLIKLILIQFHDNLSDRQLWNRVQTDLAYRWFLGLGINDHLPDVTTLNKFRKRLGSEGFERLFQQVVTQCRQQGLIRDRLRIKDATHMVANIAIPAGLTLVAQARNRLLNRAMPFASEQVQGEKIRIGTIRASTDSQSSESRLLARIEHLRDILTWVDRLSPPSDLLLDDCWQSLQQAKEIARKVLAGHDFPSAGNKIRSVSDPDARRGRHGEFYDGYMLDVCVDADSELFTAINVLQADGHESDDTLELVDQEFNAQGNQIENLSIDGAGYDGRMLRELEDPNGRNVKAFIPDRQSSSIHFSSEEFKLSEDESFVTCPASKRSQYKQRDNRSHSNKFRFAKEDCAQCPLAKQCIKSGQKFGRSTSKSDYAIEHRRIRERSKTEEYQKIKRDHPVVERKLGHLVHIHGGRRARYWGLDRVKCQGFMMGIAANIKRMLSIINDTFLTASRKIQKQAGLC